MSTATKAAHTPGPWIVAPGIENKQVLVIGSPQVVSGPLAEVRLPHYHNLGSPQLRQEEREANAHLIAAAPEMLEACSYAFIDISALLLATDWELAPDVRVKLQETATKCEAAIQKARETA